MQSLAPAFAQAMANHQAGRVTAAADGYRRILSAMPDHAYALHGLGVIALQTGRQDEARVLIEQAIAVEPNFPEAYVNRGNLLRAGRRAAESKQSYLRAIVLRPDDVEAPYNCGALLQMIADSPDATACYQRTLGLAPNHPKALNNLGILHKIAGRPERALLYFRRALACNPDFAEAWYNCGVILAGRGDFESACAAYRAAIARKPDYADAYNNLGFALSCLGRADIAEKSLVAALILAPQRPETLNNLGMACQGQGRLDDALACYQAAVAHRPDFAEAHNNRGMALLSAGRFEEGWREREWRWQTPHLAPAHVPFSVPQWRGEPAEGQRILIHAEQGFGDSLQFCRYLPLVAARGLRVILAAPVPLHRLLGRLAGVERILAENEVFPPVDLHCPMMSLPLAFSTTLANVPADVPYLSADSESIAGWKRHFEEDDPRCRVGLAWAGRSRAEIADLSALDRRRSIAPERLAPLSACPGVTFFSLQKIGPPPPASLAMVDLMAEVADFADTAALIAHLDLVICVDTAVAHLAAALGKPVWLLNRFDSCWRWLRDRDDSPWYPTLRQFRQPSPGDWDHVLAAAGRTLASERPHLTRWRRATPS